MIGASDYIGSEGDIEADSQRIHQMLARAPADRSWRRRSWLVLSRSCPTRVKIANGNVSYSSVSSSRKGSNGTSAKMSRISGEDAGGGERETEDQMMADFRDLVTRLVGLEADGLFRSVVGFL
ncbi:unnamed protein product [Ectocarpus sp. 13 AM-2016]